MVSFENIRAPTDRDFPACAWLARDIKRYGPRAACRSAVSLSAADAYCRRLARCHGENFMVASLVLPRVIRRHFYRIYAYCRWADDLADETGDPAYSLCLLDWWQASLDACYAGRATHPVFIALRDTVTSYDLPATPFEDLLRAFRQDQHVTRYVDFQELQQYCCWSANPVGHLILHLAKCHDAARCRLSDSICTGLQLANFCQGVTRDWACGRIYVPRADLVQFGCAESDLGARRATAALRRLMQFEVARADEFLRAGWPLVHRVPRWVRADIEMFIRGGLGILQVIRNRDYDVWTRPPRVGGARKLSMLARALWRAHVT